MDDTPSRNPRQRDPFSRPPRDRTRLATVTLHLSAIFYVLGGCLLAIVPFTWNPVVVPDFALRVGIVLALAALCLGLASLSWSLVHGLRRRRRWAYVTALVMFALYLPSAFLPLGAVGLFGLLSRGTRRRFRVRRKA